ncbi:MAG: MgtC/SapB family protein [Candidatus Koribacter versatilis]|uniref:MgtC/SapB family protein n=1 Tax=Candidatus Korobacter versatilis TaxID=658062 RepID=A0A932AAT1_9BACT|nr:MgtC/SapB family protein [Candidatus Koribacter versatilis]
MQLLWPDWAFLVPTLTRLVLAAVLGGAIGLERELKHKPAGLRTNLFICVGAAMFTLLSDRLAGAYGGDHTRIAAQIIPGIGFIGAGSILHSRGSVTGLTTAATLFVVASIGMAVGGGLYVTAVLATIIVGIALNSLLWFETRFNLKPLVVHYDVVSAQADALIADVNQVLRDEGHAMRSVQIARQESGTARLQFTVEATRREQHDLFDRFRHLASAQEVHSSTPELVE